MNILTLSTNYKYHQDLLQFLSDNGITPTHATSHKPHLERQNGEFYSKNNIKLINGQDFYQIKKIQKIVPVDAPALDRETLDKFEYLERDFYSLSDRYSFFPKPFRYRKRLFRHGLRYWLDFYAKNKIDAVFSICTPHNFPDFMAFHVARNLGIKTVMTTDVMINDHVLLLSDFDDAYKVPADFMQNATREEVIAAIRPSLYAKSQAESAFIKLSKRINDKTLGLKNVNTQAKQVNLSSKIEKIKKRAGKYISPEIFEPKFKTAFAMNGLYSDFRRRLIRGWLLTGYKNLRKSYESLATEADLNCKYLYFAMHLSPERTSQPEAGIFEDHLLAIEILSRSVPKDWLVYVKENPTQYGKKNMIGARHHRDEMDYLDYTRLPNVRLIKQDVKTAELIKNAQVVSTLKGSVAWEALNSGKPCLIFANAWYAACRSAFRVSSVEECSNAIEEMLKKTQPEVEMDILKYLAYMQDKLIIGSMGGNYNLEVAEEPYEVQVSSLGEHIIAKLRA